MTHPHCMTPLIFLKDNLACPKCHGSYLGLYKLYLWFNKKYIIDLEMMSRFRAWLAPCLCRLSSGVCSQMGHIWGLEPSGTCWKGGIKESNRFLMLSFRKWKSKMKSVLNNTSIRSRVGSLDQWLHVNFVVSSTSNFLILYTIFLVWAPQYRH